MIKITRTPHLIAGADVAGDFVHRRARCGADLVARSACGTPRLTSAES